MMHNGQWHERQWERIEEEYQEPAKEVVRVMHHDMRIPLCAVAEAMYVSEGTLRKWCKWWKIKTLRRGYKKKDTPGKVQLRARLMGYSSVSDAIGAMRQSGLRWDDIQLRLKCSTSTISRYIREDDKGYYNLTDRGLQSKRQSIQSLNEKMKNDEVERGGFAKIPLQMVSSLP